MKIGKVSEVVLKRSVLKNITAKNKRVIEGAKVAGDCSIISNSGKLIAMATSGVVDYAKIDKEYYTFYKCFNNLCARNALPISMSVNVIIPLDGKEKQIKEVMKCYDELCKKHGLEICNGHTQYSAAVNEVVTTVTMLGEVIEQKNTFTEQTIEDNMDNEEATAKEINIVMTKAIGIEGTSIIAHDKAMVLKERFNGRFCDQCEKFKEYISIEKESKVAADNGAIAMHDVSGTGVFGALWEMAESFSMGLEVDLRSIPVWQESIEVSELFDINPYKMVSQGSLLIATYDGEEMVKVLEDNDVPAAVIGKMVSGNDKILLNNDEVRYLEPPRGDDIYKLFE